MAKMNLNFLLSSDKDKDKDNNNGNNGSNRAPRADNRGPSRSETSPLSVDFIAPRTSEQQASSSSGRFPSQRRGAPVGPGAHGRAQPFHGARTGQRAWTAREQAAQASRGTLRGKPPKTGQGSLRSPASTEVKPHVCPSCERSFYKLEQLKRHDRLVHLNLRPFVCTTCDLSFGTKQNMQVHLTTRKHQHRLETLQASQRSHGSSSSRQPPQ